MWRALSTNFRVLRVYSRLVAEGEMFPTMKVKVLDVRLSCSSRVSLDSRNEATFLPPLDRLYITLPSVDSDWLMFLSSLKC